MQPSRDQTEAYFFGSPQRIGEKILFIKREDGWRSTPRTWLKSRCSATSGVASPAGSTANLYR